MMAPTQTLTIAINISTPLNNFASWIDYHLFEGRITDELDWPIQPAEIFYKETRGSHDKRRLYYMMAHLIEMIKGERVIKSSDIEIGVLVAESRGDYQIIVKCWRNDDTYLGIMKQFFGDIIKEFLPYNLNAEMIDPKVVELDMGSNFQDSHLEQQVGSQNMNPQSPNEELRKTVVNDVETIDLDDIDNILPDKNVMRKYHKDYSPITAKEILQNIPEAFTLYNNQGGHWGPGVIAEFCGIRPATVGRYLSAFKSAGLKRLKYKNRSIPIP